ncbi:uncharacterized protein LOC135845815 [Planococcus citri]|uniref:uncharacterized protein LOC135845815 n=1 Tax=Planococcus citri TaxID=170843 RepID=UPI0031F810D5
MDNKTLFEPLKSHRGNQRPEEDSVGVDTIIARIAAQNCSAFRKAKIIVVSCFKDVLNYETDLPQDEGKFNEFIKSDGLEHWCRQFNILNSLRENLALVTFEEDETKIVVRMEKFTTIPDIIQRSFHFLKIHLNDERFLKDKGIIRLLLAQLMKTFTNFLSVIGNGGRPPYLPAVISEII